MLFALLCFVIPPFADVLGHSVPSAAGILMAALSVPAVLFVDATSKRIRYKHRGTARRVLH